MCLLFVLLALTLSTAQSGVNNSASSNDRKQAEKQWNSYSKHQKKAQKQQAKAEKKAMKKWKQQHPTTTSVL